MPSTASDVGAIHDGARSPDEAPAPRVETHRFHELHEYTENILDFDSHFVRFASDPVRAGLVRIELDRLVVLRGEGEFPHHGSQATFPAHAYIFANGVDGGEAVWHGVRATENTLYAYAPGDEHVGLTRGRVSWGAVLCDPETLEQHALALGYEPLTASPGPVVSLTPEARARFHGALKRALATAAFGPRPFESAGVRAAIEEQLLGALVHATQPTCEPRSAGAVSHERVVRQAFAFLESRPRDALYVSDLCRAAGVSERTLRNAFQDVFGVSPIRYLHLRRMELARREIHGADQRTTQVSEIAQRLGFTNLGRFAAEFRALYGVSPSQMLRGERR